MRLVGIILLAVGISLLVFVGYSYFQEQNRLRSPIPEGRGVKVIFVTPSR